VSPSPEQSVIIVQYVGDAEEKNGRGGGVLTTFGGTTRYGSCTAGVPNREEMIISIPLTTTSNLFSIAWKIGKLGSNLGKLRQKIR
jgi:hypothetical protein